MLKLKTEKIQLLLGKMYTGETNFGFDNVSKDIDNSLAYEVPNLQTKHPVQEYTISCEGVF